jgi:hypothetical protein
MPREIARGITTPSGGGNISDIERLQFVSDCEIMEKRRSRENRSTPALRVMEFGLVAELLP